MRKFIYLLMIFSFCQNSFCQNKLKIDAKSVYSFDGSKVLFTDTYSFPPSNEAKAVVDKILLKVGLKPNFTLIATNIKDAEATFENGKRIILYSEIYIKNIDLETKSNWGTICILAHEIGHHLNGHNFDQSEYGPSKELEADEFAGFVMYKLGATLNEALSPFNTLPESASETHPSRSARSQAASVGWTKAKEEDGKIIKNKFEYLEVSITSIKKSGQSISVALKFYANNTQKYGLAYALKAENSDGIADYWKFSPFAKGKLIDNLGNEYRIESINGMGYARDTEDWTILKNKDEGTAIIEFIKNNRSESSSIGTTFDFHLEIWLAYADNNGKTKKGAYSINLQGVKLSN